MRISDWSSDVCSSDLNASKGEDFDHICSICGLDAFPCDGNARPVNFIRSDQENECGCRRSLYRATVSANPSYTSVITAWPRVLQALLYKEWYAGAPGGLCSVQALPSARDRRVVRGRSEEHTSELQSLMRISYAVFCLKKKK